MKYIYMFFSGKINFAARRKILNRMKGGDANLVNGEGIFNKPLINYLKKGDHHELRN